MLKTSRSIGQLLAQRASGMTTISNAPTDPLTTAAFQFMADATKSNTEERLRIDAKVDAQRNSFDNKLENQRNFVDDRFERALATFSSSQESLRADFSSSQQSLRTDLKSDINKVKERVQHVEKMIAYASGGAGLLVLVAGIAGRAGLFS